MIPKSVLDHLGQSAAHEVHRRTGRRCGYIATHDAIEAQRAIFVFEIGRNRAHATVGYERLKNVFEHSRIVEFLIDAAIVQTGTNSVAKRQWELKRGCAAPEIEPWLDQRQRRHHRLMGQGYKMVIQEG